jgi:hypothetical protein
MRKKGRDLNTNPEKTSATTAGIQLTRGANVIAVNREQLTGANQPADEAGVADLITEFVKRSRL